MHMLPSVTTTESEMVDPMGDAYLAGYQNCIAVASTYLEETENMSQDDPFIRGLVQYLEERQQQRYLLYMMAQCNNNISGDLSDSDLHDLSLRTVDAEDDSRTSFDLLTDCNRCEQNRLSDSTTAIRNYMEIPNHSEMDVSQTGLVQPLTSSPRNSDIGLSMVSLAQLVQNNPAIASLTDEIISLMNEEDLDEEGDFDNVNYQNVSEADSGINESC